MNKYKGYSKKLFLAVLLSICVTGASSADAGSGLKPVSLGAAETFAILSQSGITDVYRSAIVGRCNEPHHRCGSPSYVRGSVG
jgi:hypothetical protein